VIGIHYLSYYTEVTNNKKLKAMSSMRIYNVNESVVFKKTKEEFGGLSNMAAGFSVHVNEVIIPTVEHLYQAMRFPLNPDLQWDIINEPSPMKAKWVGRAHIKETREDWESIQFKVMQWAIELKLSQNWESFSSLLRATGNKNIVELTDKPKIWGAVRNGDYLEGVNALGRLLMYVREAFVKPNIRKRCIQPIDILNFDFLGYPIGIICEDDEVISYPQDYSQRDFVFE
jgi:ribA/ribD-fused uncharacterized protein